MATPGTCEHCGTPCADGDARFCCAGCEQVYRLIRESDLDEFYAKQDRVGRPVEGAPFLRRDVSWADTSQREAEARVAADGTASAVLHVGGMTCLGCVWLVERLARREPGVRAARCSLDSGLLQLRWRPRDFDLKIYVETLQRFGYLAEVRRHGRGGTLSPLAWRTLLCGIFAGNGLLLALPELLQVGGLVDYTGLFTLLSLVFASLVCLVGAGPHVSATVALIRRRRVGFDLFATAWVLLSFLTALGVVFSSGQWSLGLAGFSIAVFLLLFGQWVRTCFVSA